MPECVFCGTKANVKTVPNEPDYVKINPKDPNTITCKKDFLAMNTADNGLKPMIQEEAEIAWEDIKTTS